MGTEAEQALDWVERCCCQLMPLISQVNRAIWTYAELSGQEYQSAALLVQVLREYGFSVEEDVCGRPTGFIASYGSGGPVIGFLGEYDALPGLSQAAGVPEPAPVAGSGFGHGCGHCALGSGSLAAALIVRRYLEEADCQGTIRYYGCCSEESDGIKPLMARSGAFDDVDCVFAWHPGGETGVPNTQLAAMQGFQAVFHLKRPRARGEVSPAADACELMNVGVNYLRKHVSPDARIHYAYTDPLKGTEEQAALSYVVRAPRLSEVKEILERVTACARGAAQMTGTQVEILPQSGCADRFQNNAVAQILSGAAMAVGAPRWEREDYDLARAFQAQYGGAAARTLEELVRRKYPGTPPVEIRDHPLDTTVEPFDPEVCKKSGASSDVGDVGYAASTASMRVACAALGTPAYSWFMTGMAASSIAEKGIACAAKILSLAAIRVYETPALLQGAQAKRLERIGGTDLGTIF
ncbi:amidohydrolase [Pseudoflavonifractor sp. 524-17]|uniref:amidohydrolase n=1 Tax=Pseudoflavonifractor sp. 524-17 TaxID=2304577 RepID=UPI001379AA2D|nr:amidohydrolase [Pseudoflavonifractor sp. 524-17]